MTSPPAAQPTTTLALPHIQVTEPADLYVAVIPDLPAPLVVGWHHADRRPIALMRHGARLPEVLPPALDELPPGCIHTWGDAHGLDWGDVFSGRGIPLNRPTRPELVPPSLRIPTPLPGDTWRPRTTLRRPHAAA